jgi:hypothetical protein
LHWHLFPLTFIEYHWKDPSDQVVGKIIMRPRGVAGIGLDPKSALWLFPSAAAQQAATLDARRRKWKFLYWRGALTSKYPVPSGPRDTKALTFRQIFIQ